MHIRVFKLRLAKSSLYTDLGRFLEVGGFKSDRGLQGWIFLVFQMNQVLITLFVEVRF